MANKKQSSVPADLKKNNRSVILSVFKDGHEHTANDISSAVKLSRQTVMKTIQHYINKGIVVYTKKGDSTNFGGKRPDLFSLNPDKYLLSVQLWPDVIRFTLSNLRSEIIAQEAYDPSSFIMTTQSISEKAKAAREFVSSIITDIKNLCGIAISTPGIIDYNTQRLKFNSHNPNNSSNIGIADAFRPFFSDSTVILLENVGKMTARVWLHNPEMQGKRMLTVFSSWGISGSFINKDNIMNGHNSLIGEIGHMILDPNSSIQCGCGCKGCFEQLVSIITIRNKLRKELSEHKQSSLNKFDVNEITYKDIFSESEKGDLYAMEIMRYLAYYFSIFLHNITLSFDPSIVIFQGDYAFSDDYFQKMLLSYLNIFHYYSDEGPFQTIYDTRSIVELDVHGAITMLLDSLF